MSSTRTQSELCTDTPISLFVQCPISFRLFAFVKVDDKKLLIQNLKYPVINRQLNKFTKPGIVMLSYCVNLTLVYGITDGKFVLIFVSASVYYFSSFV